MFKKIGVILSVGLLVSSMGITVFAEEKKREYSDKLISFSYSDGYEIEFNKYDDNDDDISYFITSKDNDDVKVIIWFLFDKNDYMIPEEYGVEKDGVDTEITENLLEGENLVVYKELDYSGLENDLTDFFRDIYDSVKVADNAEELLKEDIIKYLYKDYLFYIPWGTPMNEIQIDVPSEKWSVSTSEGSIEVNNTSGFTVFLEDTDADGCLDTNIVEGEVSIYGTGFLEMWSHGYIDTDTWMADGEEVYWSGLYDAYGKFGGIGSSYEKVVGKYESDTKRAIWEFSAGSEEGAIHVHYEASAVQ